MHIFNLWFFPVSKIFLRGRTVLLSSLYVRVMKETYISKSNNDIDDNDGNDKDKDNNYETDAVADNDVTDKDYHDHNNNSENNDDWW